MNAARAYRRLKEVEEQKLQNRLALLSLELERSSRKINETEERTQNILLHRKKILDKHQQKIDDSTRREEEQRIHMEMNNKARERMATLRRANVLSVQYAKREEAKVVLHERVRNEQLIKEHRSLEISRANEVKKLIREQRVAGQEARKQEMLRKREEARKEFQRRVEEEAMRSNSSEGKVEEMEKMELELIDKLEAAQNNQRKAYEDLEKALLSSKSTIVNVSREALQANALDCGTPRKRGGRTPRKRAQPRPLQPPVHAIGQSPVAAH